jgi:hypothetical protein
MTSPLSILILKFLSLFLFMDASTKWPLFAFYPIYSILSIHAMLFYSTFSIYLLDFIW